MKKLFLVMKAEFVRQIVLYKRYWVSSISEVFSMIMLFLGIYAASGGFSSNKDVVLINSQVVGFIFYYFITTFFSNAATTVNMIKFRGLMEQYVINRVSLSKILIIKTLNQLFFTILDALPIYLLMIVIIGYFKIHFSLHLVITFILTTLGLYGVGFFLGGLALRFKQIYQVSFILQVIFLGMMAIPMVYVPPIAEDILNFLPFQKGIVLIKELGTGIIQTVPTADLLFLFVNSMFYLIFGFVSFKVLLSYSKKKGLLATY